MGFVLAIDGKVLQLCINKVVFIITLRTAKVVLFFTFFSLRVSLAS